MNPLPESFYMGEVTEVARNLLGTRLVRDHYGVQLAGIITETEAYRGEEDLACHARNGRTTRNSVMYGRPGRAYVYFTYGMHWCLNAVCGPEGFPAAVLIRSIHPTHGLDVMATRREGRKQEEWCNGPAKLCKALGIGGEINGVNLTDNESQLWIEPAVDFPYEAILATRRVGIDHTPEPWRSKLWRYQMSNVEMFL